MNGHNVRPYGPMRPAMRPGIRNAPYLNLRHPFNNNRQFPVPLYGARPIYPIPFCYTVRPSLLSLGSGFIPPSINPAFYFHYAAFRPPFSQTLLPESYRRARDRFVAASGDKADDSEPQPKRRRLNPDNNMNVPQYGGTSGKVEMPPTHRATTKTSTTVTVTNSPSAKVRAVPLVNIQPTLKRDNSEGVSQNPAANPGLPNHVYDPRIVNVLPTK